MSAPRTARSARAAPSAPRTARSATPIPVCHHGPMSDPHAPATISLRRGDITRVTDVDAIVNAANTTLLGGGGVDGAIHRAAGKGLLAECRTLGSCETGDAKITGGYDLPVEHVIHTVGPVWATTKAEEKDRLLASCYRRSLEVAHEAHLARVAFPSISTGIYRFPVERAARIAIATIDETTARLGGFEEVVMVLFDDATLRAYEAALAERGA